MSIKSLGNFILANYTIWPSFDSPLNSLARQRRAWVSRHKSPSVLLRRVLCQIQWQVLRRAPVGADFFITKRTYAKFLDHVYKEGNWMNQNLFMLYTCNYTRICNLFIVVLTRKKKSVVDVKSCPDIVRVTCKGKQKPLYTFTQ